MRQAAVQSHEQHAANPAFARASAAAAAAVLAVGTLGTFYLRLRSGVPWRVPSVPYWYSFPFYIFPHPHLALAWALRATPAIALAVAGVLALHRSRLRWGARVAASAGLAFVLALAVSALAGGPWAWRQPLNYAGEYPAGVGTVGPIPAFLRAFPGLLASLPSHASGHPAGSMVVYALVTRVWPGLTAAALATVALGSLGAVAAGGLARDELGEQGGRLALACWVLSPGVVLYLATSADAIFATVLAAAALAAHRGLTRRSAAWTAAGGALLWVGSMLTYSAVLLLVFLGVRAAGRPRADRAWVVAWAAGTAAIVLGLAVLLWATTGYDVPAALRATHRAYQAAPGSAGREYALWLPGDVVAFGGMLGVPLLAALAILLAAACWGFTRGEVERIFQFLVPLVLVPAVRQLLAWRARLPVVAGLLLAQVLAVQLLFDTRW